MSQGQLGVLHTDSSYVGPPPSLPSQTEDMKMLRLKLQIAALKGKEEDFARRFGYSSIKDLIAGIRNLLVPNDMEVLRQFSSANLRKHLQQFQSKNGNLLTGQKIHLIFKVDNKNLSQLNKILNSSGGNGTVTYTMSGDVQFEIEWNTAAIKHIVNKMNGVHFQTNKDNIDYLKDYINNSPTTFIQIIEGRSGTTKTIDEYITENTLNPFNLTKSQIKELEKTNRPQLVEFEQKIKNFLYNELCAGASAELKRAVQIVMSQKISQLSDISFFTSGNNISGTVGAFGELQTAIMFQYLANKTPNKTAATRVSKLIGDMVNGYNQQLHTDLEILEAFGVQVKNYNSDYNNRLKQERTVNVHLHPSEIAALGASEGVVDYIVNSYFNTSIQPYSTTDLDQFFKSHASELLNLDLNPTINDQVVFYMIGTNFIPGSVILEQAFIDLTLKVNTTISGQMGKSDYEYNAPQKKPDWERPFHEWWKSDDYSNISIGNFSPTGKNMIRTWDSKVSITTSFTYSALWGGDYDILKR